MGKTLAQMTAEIREVNVEKGWRPAEGGPGSNTFGDYIALLHSEVAVLRADQRRAAANEGEMNGAEVEFVGARIPVETIDYPNASIRLDVSGNVVSVEFKGQVFVE